MFDECGSQNLSVNISHIKRLKTLNASKLLFYINI